MNDRYLLYLDVRDLPLERDAEILAAAESGHRLVIATDRPEKYRYHQVDAIIHTPVGQYDIAQRDIVAYIDRHRLKLAGVLCWKDREVELASDLAAHFHLPGNRREVVRRVRDKAAMRQALDGLDVSPNYSVISSQTDFESAIATMSYPCLLKPAGNSGSRGIFRVDNPQSHGAYERFRDYNARGVGDMFSYYTDHALLEEEVSGSEHSVAGLVHGGEVYVTAIADKQFERDIFMQYENVVPSRLSVSTQIALVAAVTKAIGVIGFTCGGFHADAIVDSRDRPYLLEIGARFGGEMINSHLIPLAYGGDSPYRQLIDLMTGGKPSIALDQYRHPRMQAGARIIRAPRVGRIKQIHGLDQLVRHPAVRALMPMKGPGSSIHRPQEKFKEYEVAYIIAQCGLDDDMHALLEALEGQLSVEMYDQPIAV